MRHKVGLARLLVIVFLLLLTPVTPAEDPLEDSYEQTFPLDPAGTVSVRNIDGSVLIYGATGNRVEIYALKRAFTPARLNGIKVQVDAQPGAIRIETSAPPAPRWGWSDRSGTVDYIITVPQTARLTQVAMPAGEMNIDGMRGGSVQAQLSRGRLIAHNCFCDQILRLGSGLLNLGFDWVEERSFKIDATVNDGNVRAMIPLDASFKLEARSETGNVSSDFSALEKRRRGGVREIDESVGDNPQSTISLRVRDGNIRVEQVD